MYFLLPAGLLCFYISFGSFITAGASVVHPCFDNDLCTDKMQGKPDNHYENFAYDPDDTRYYICFKNNGIIINRACMECPSSLRFKKDGLVGLCVPNQNLPPAAPPAATPAAGPPAAGIPVSCPTVGVSIYPHPDDCTKYIQCVHGRKYERQCGAGTQFNSNTNNCDRFYYGECHGTENEVNGAYGNWGSYGSCSVSCGGGEKSRTRSCDSPAQAGGGLPCSGPSVETADCNTDPCPINGQYGDWGSYGSCSVTCGGGKKSKTRSCDSPPQAYGGLPCSGPSEETADCNTDPCKAGEDEACNVNDDCQEGLECSGGTCFKQRGEEYDPCNVNDDCQDDLICLGGECIVVDGSLYHPCDENDDCRDHLECRNQECRRHNGQLSDPCDENDDCEDGLGCYNRECEFHPCEVHDDCQDGWECDDGECYKSP